MNLEAMTRKQLEEKKAEIRNYTDFTKSKLRRKLIFNLAIRAGPYGLLPETLERRGEILYACLKLCIDREIEGYLNFNSHSVRINLFGLAGYYDSHQDETTFRRREDYILRHKIPDKEFAFYFPYFEYFIKIIEGKKQGKNKTMFS